MIFRFLDYKAYLRQKIRENQRVYGYKTQLAKAARCRNSYLSQVLNGDFDLSPEHALGLSGFWQHSPPERDYFLQLVNYARAGTTELKRYYEGLLRKLSADYEREYRRGNASEVPEDWKAQFYSSWHYTAIHDLTTFPGGQTVEAIAKRLEIPKSLVDEALHALEKMGFVEVREKVWHAKVIEVIAPHGTHYQALHVNHWAHRAAMDVMRRNRPWESVHKCWVFGIRKDDYEKLKEMIEDHLMKSTKIIPQSQREELACMNLHLFVV